jgi:hypothetical protein
LAYVYVAPGGIITVGHSLTMSSLVRCTGAPGVSSFPAFTKHLGIAQATAGTWDVSVSDRRGWLSAGPKLLNGGGLAITPVADTISLAVDSAVYASYGKQAIAFSATPLFQVASTVQLFETTLTGDVTVSTLSDAVPGGVITFKICQDATGGRLFSWPTNVKGGMNVTAVASQCSVQSFVWDGSAAYATSTGASL